MISGITEYIKEDSNSLLNKLKANKIFMLGFGSIALYLIMRKKFKIKKNWY